MTGSSGQRFFPLQVAKLFGVGRGDIDGRKVQRFARMPQNGCEVFRAVFTVLVGPEVQTHRNSSVVMRDTRSDGVHAVKLDHGDLPIIFSFFLP